MMILSSVGMGKRASDTHRCKPSIQKRCEPDDRHMTECLVKAFHVPSVPIQQSLLPYHFYTPCLYTGTLYCCLLTLAHRCNTLDIPPIRAVPYSTHRRSAPLAPYLASADSTPHTTIISLCNESAERRRRQATFAPRLVRAGGLPARTIHNDARSDYYVSAG